MARSIDSGENANRTNPSWSVGFFALPLVLVIALVALALTQPIASTWISEAAQAEFVGTECCASGSDATGTSIPTFKAN